MGRTMDEGMRVEMEDGGALDSGDECGGDVAPAAPADAAAAAAAAAAAERAAEGDVMPCMKSFSMPGNLAAIAAAAAAEA